MKLSAYLSDWNSVNVATRELKEAQLWALLELERQGLNRVYVKLRIYGRANKLRGEREARELKSNKFSNLRGHLA